MDKIKVPDLPAPTVKLCYAQCMPTEPPFTHAMERCDRKAGHGGKHSWEWAREVELLSELLIDAGVRVP